MKKQTKNLAWQGTTFKEKRKLLNESLILSENLRLDGKIKDSFLSLSSTCIDIINTAKAVKITSSWTKGWEKLFNECIKITKNTIKKFRVKKYDDWSLSDFEVMATILIINSSKINLLKAQEYIEEGIKKSVDLKDNKSEALLFARILKIDIERNDLNKLKSDIESLAEMIIEIDDPKVLTRTYRAVAESSKFLAIEIAKKSKLDNQILKAKSI